MPTFGFVDVLVDDSADCPGCALRWKAESPPRAVTSVRYDAAVCDVVGWSSAGGGSRCPATAVTVEDSGGGTATLVWGGDLGLRLRPRGGGGETIAEPYLLLDPADMDV